MRDSTGKLLGAILLMSSTNDRFDSSDVEVVTVAALMAAGRLRSDADEAVKRELESHLRQSQKMEAVGKLAGGIAHDFNNILSGILGFSSYLLRSAPPESELHRDLNMIMKSAERASDLTRQLLSFSRKRHIEKKPVNLNNVVLEVESIIKHSVAANLRVKTKLDNDIFPVLADEGQIHQVIMNLCINAADAMNRKKGTLTIRSSQRTLSPTERQLIEAPETGADTYVVLEITDTGPGIPDHVLEHLFEPFFTTKPEEEGTGLGLSIVYGIVTNHDGGILVDSELGKGASFTIFLPVSLEDGPPATIDETDAQLRGTESILIVDNEAIIRQMASQALKAYGYQVSLASGGKEALAITRDNPGKFDLMLIDLHMTDQGGAETIQQIIADKRQRIKPVLMSAFASDDHCKHLFENQEVRFLQKPFTSDELARNIRVALDDG
jgi:signal transduction histidine kinase/ActR/RegA family two-component response regulator